MRTPLLIAPLLLVAALFTSAAEREMSFTKLTPIVSVEAIEPCLPFWTEGLGFEQTMQVEEGGRLAFAAVARNGIEVMYQTFASIEADFPVILPLFRRSLATLYVQVTDVAAVAAGLDGIEGVEMVRPMRTTFYGAKEIFVRAPCGTIVGFAEMLEE